MSNMLNAYGGAPQVCPPEGPTINSSDDQLLNLIKFGLRRRAALATAETSKGAILFRTGFKVIIAAAILFSIGRRALGMGSRRPIKRVAIVGGGIAGAGAAYALRKAGIDAVIFEKKPKLGGNAKSFTWNVEGKKVETGLAVLAFPHEYFHTYTALMKALDMDEGVLKELEYFVAEKNFRGPGPVPEDQLEVVFAYGKPDFVPADWLKDDLERWARLVAFVKGVNDRFAPSDYKSLYRMSITNPLNLLSLRRLTKLYGMSDYFWERVFVPIHTSTFLEVEMDSVPAVMADLLDDLVPFTRTPQMRAWTTHAYDIFERMQKIWPKEAVRTSCAVEKVDFVQGKDGSLDVQVWHEDLAEKDPPEVYDALIFACAAPCAESILKHHRAHLSVFTKEFWLAHLEGFLLRTTLYTVDRDKTFEQGVVHSDGRVFPEKYRGELLERHCNYMVVDGKNPRNVENHFIISSWAPTATTPDIKGKLPMLISYNCTDKTDKVDAEWTVTSREAHPSLTMVQLINSIVVWPLLQGFRNRQVYYCGSGFVAANGHDLSLLSGIVAASELGAPYPFGDSKNGLEDFKRLRRMMLLFWA